MSKTAAASRACRRIRMQDGMAEKAIGVKSPAPLALSPPALLAKPLKSGRHRQEKVE
jgi:hypothetical protein